MNTRNQGPAKSGVLYVRCAPDMLAALDELVNEERKHTGYNLSRADVVRKLLSDAMGLDRGKG